MLLLISHLSSPHPSSRGSQVAQLGDFDEQLYKVTGAGEDQYLIATSEQAAMHLDFSRTE